MKRSTGGAELRDCVILSGTGSGKGALEANLSYPLDRLLGGGPDLYLFGQGFVGYGENLLDYDVHTTRFRVGFALVR